MLSSFSLDALFYIQLHDASSIDDSRLKKGGFDVKFTEVSLKCKVAQIVLKLWPLVLVSLKMAFAPIDSRFIRYSLKWRIAEEGIR